MISRSTWSDVTPRHPCFFVVLPGRPSAQLDRQETIEDPTNRKWVSIASCWEIAIKAGLRKLILGELSEAYISASLSRTGFDLLPISLAHATRVETLPHHHRDPFDRLLIAQALIEVVPIVSVDVVFDPYGVSRLW